MASETILLKGQAKRLGIENYRRMSQDELREAIKNAQTATTTPQKGKASDGARPKVQKGKSKPAPAKSKKSPTKGASTKGTVKRQAAKPRKASTAKGKATLAKGRATVKRRTARRAAPRRGKAVEGRAVIDRSKIDWHAESNVGQRGKRAEVLAELRKRRGNYDKVFEALKHRAKVFYPAKSKKDAEHMLRWLINRVAFDFVLKSGQHNPGTRAKYGKSKKVNDVRRREERAEQRAEREKAARKAKRAARPTAKRAPAKRKAQKTARKSSSARKGR